MFAFKIDILLSEKENKGIRSLSNFISRFIPEYFKTYQETSKRLGFKKVLTLISSDFLAIRIL